jgi:hypothetical protein
MVITGKILVRTHTGERSADAGYDNEDIMQI